MNKLPFSVVVPARYGSERLPGKPLAEINGKSMIAHVWERAVASGARRVVIATDDHRIEEAARGFGAEVCMTSAQHASGSDRVAEAVAQMGLGDEDIVVNLQGDEPRMPPALIAQVAACLAAHPQAVMSSLYQPIDDEHTLHNPAVVKVVCDSRGYALYFSRAPIPWARQEGGAPGGFEAAAYRHHLGIYGYRVAYLRVFTGLARAVPERLEKLEQLRALCNGDRIILEEAAEYCGGGVDTAPDLEEARRETAPA